MIDQYKCPICEKVCKNNLSLSRHFMMFHKKTNEELYNLINPVVNRKCPNCFNDTPFNGFPIGYGKYCCKKCSSEHQKDKTLVNNRMEKTRKTMLEKYGVENPSQSDEIQNKREQTFLNKYGSTCSFTSPSISEKIKNSVQSKYKCDNVFANEVVKQKIRETNFKKYGSNTPSKSKTVIEKAKRTNLERYGVTSTAQRTCVKNDLKLKTLSEAFNNLLNNPIRNNNCSPLFTIDDYVGGKKDGKSVKYKFKCNKCGHEFEDNLESGKIPICINCFPQNRSKFELQVVEFIKSNINVEIIENDRSILNGKELDIYIPKKKIAIECNGISWHSESFGKRSRSYHIDKTIECDKLGIKLIQIWDYEWITKQNIVKNKILNIMNGSSNKTYARKCEIVEITNREKMIFLDNYHIQGNDKSSVYYGLKFNGEIVSVMSFGPLRVALGNKGPSTNEYELYRYCSSKTVIGGASKLLNHFIKNIKPLKIITYADIRYSGLSSMYDKIGFKLIGMTTPNYWYFKLSSPINIWHRFSFRKNVLSKKLNVYDDKLNEYDNMLNNNYDRIWDCGNLKYEMTFN